MRPFFLRHFVILQNTEACPKRQLRHVLMIMRIQNQHSAVVQQLWEFLEKPLINAADIVVCQPPHLKGHVRNHFVEPVAVSYTHLDCGEGDEGQLAET